MKNTRINIVEYYDRLCICSNEKLLAGYIYLGTWKPYFYPLNGPSGNVVRGIDGSEHHNQYGLSLAYGGHGEGGSTNIWSDYDEPPYGPCGKILHQSFEKLSGGDGFAEIVEKTIYVKADGSKMCDETRSMKIFPLPDDELFIEIVQEITRPDDPGDNPFIFYARVADTMRVTERGKPRENPGEIENSDGKIGEEATRDQRVSWCDYSGPVGDGISGIALLDHPENSDYPALFFTRGYGVFSAKHLFPKDLDKITLKWGAYVHAGDVIEGKVDEKFQQMFAESSHIWR